MSKPKSSEAVWDSINTESELDAELREFLKHGSSYEITPLLAEFMDYLRDDDDDVLIIAMLLDLDAKVTQKFLLDKKKCFIEYHNEKEFNRIMEADVD